MVYLADSDLGNINMTYADFTAAFIQDTVNGYGYVLVVTNDSNNPQLNSGALLTNDEMQNIKGTKYKKASKAKVKFRSTKKVKSNGYYVTVRKVKYSNGNNKWKKYANCYKSHSDFLHINKGLTKRHTSQTFKNRIHGGASVVLGIGTCVAGVALSETGFGEAMSWLGCELFYEGAYELVFGKEL